jgi:hypothetical protein
MSTGGNLFYPEKPIVFLCEICDFNTCNRKDYTRHLETKKHFLNQVHKFSIDIIKKTPYECKCGKMYKDKSGLWRHKKKCALQYSPEETDKTFDINHQVYEPEKLKETETLIQYLIKENAEFKQLLMDQNKQMIELAKNAGSNNTTTTNNNSFNLNFFLNETCKNALNIMDFVNQLQIGIKELEETGRLGFTDGISQIFINGLKDLDISQRPVHCSDFKREILYIKNDDQWNKENEEKTLLTNAIKYVAHKNIKQIPVWQEANPGYNDPDSKQSDKYMKLIYNSMSGSTKEEQQQNICKIIKNVTKEVIIDKKHPKIEA